MLCSEACIVNRGWDGIQAVSLRCRAWTCPICQDARKKQLVALAKSGNPDTFITLTVNPQFGSSPYDRARRLAEAWRVIVRLVKAKYGYKKLPYFCVFEATKNGEPHLHILCRVKWISQKWLSVQMATLMLAPIVDIRRVRNKSKLAHYISKYCGKDPHRFKTCKRYWTTRDYEQSTFEPERPEGRWHTAWTVVRTPLDRLADEWRAEGLDVETSRHRIVARWRGPPEDELAAVRYIEARKRAGRPW